MTNKTQDGWIDSRGGLNLSTEVKQIPEWQLKRALSGLRQKIKFEGSSVVFNYTKNFKIFER